MLSMMFLEKNRTFSNIFLIFLALKSVKRPKIDFHAVFSSSISTFSFLCYYQDGSSVPPIILDFLISQYNGFSVQVNLFFYIMKQLNKVSTLEAVSFVFL